MAREFNFKSKHELDYGLILYINKTKTSWLLVKDKSWWGIIEHPLMQNGMITPKDFYEGILYSVLSNVMSLPEPKNAIFKYHGNDFENQIRLY